MMKPAKIVSMRRSLLVSLVLFIGLFTASLLGVVYVMGEKAATDLSRRLIDKTSDLVSREISVLFEPVNTALRSFRHWLGVGVLNPNDTAQLNALCKSLIGLAPQVTSVNTGAPDGGGFLLLITETGWKNRIVTPQTVGVSVEWIETDKDFRETSRKTSPSDYDPRNRPWYKNAMAAGEGLAVWSDPYQFLTTKDPGITASMRIGNAGEDQIVLAFDIMLKDLGEIAERIRPSANGYVAIFDRQGRLIGIPDSRLAAAGYTGDPFLKDPGQLPLHPLREAVESWKADSRAGLARVISTPAGRWWISFQDFNLGGSSGLVYAVIVPESDLMGGVYRQLAAICAVSLGVTALALLAAAVFIRRFSAPLENLSSQAGFLMNLDLEMVSPVKTSLKEVHSLSEAQERMSAAMSSFIRYLPMDVVRDLLERGEVAEVGGEKRDITVAVTDIAGFTTFSEKMTPQELTVHLSEYLQTVTEILQKHGGTVDKYIGDAVVCLWNAPRDLRDHTRRALDAVWEMKSGIDAANVRWRSEGRPEMPTRIGLHRGEAVVGNLGSETRLNFTALGKTVVLAGDLEALNKTYGTTILVSEDIARHAGEGYSFRRVEAKSADAQGQSVEILEYLGPA